MVVVTAYDAAFAAVAEDAGVDAILVGDSLANVMLGKKSTREIGMAVMEIFTRAVTEGTENTHIIADMPFGSCPDPGTALENAGKFISLGAHSVKVEGYQEEIIGNLTGNGIPVVGHLGLLPQTASSFKKMGATEEEKDTLLNTAGKLERSGAIAVVLEHLSFSLAAEVTASVKIPTIGIGAGKEVDGQVLVLHDVLGITSSPLPPFARKFADVYQTSLKGLRDYTEAVRPRRFP
jgi:3-methyl-2-oxobutanoate hydroxymethyltransferase